MTTTTTDKPRRRLTDAERRERAEIAARRALEALGRAQNGHSLANFAAIYDGMMAKGIEEAAIMPRVNVFTYAAWKAKGQQVERGEHGVKIPVYVPIDVDVPDGRGGTRRDTELRPRTATVFHVSQTKEVAA